MKASICIIILVQFFLSCKENDPASPEEATPTNAIAEVTIGGEGGVIETDDFKLMVPNGAFSSDANLKLYQETENPFGINAVSPHFRIEGIPNDFHTKLQISIKYTGSLSGNSGIAVGKNTEIPLYDNIILDYDILDAEESNGFLTCELNPSPSGSLNKLSLSELEKAFSAVTGGRVFESSHFKYSGWDWLNSEEQFSLLEDFFEELYNKYGYLGFDYSQHYWPIKIEMRNSVFGSPNFSVYPLAEDRLSAKTYIKFLIPENYNIQDGYSDIERVYAYCMANMYYNWDTDVPWISWAFLQFVTLDYYYWDKVHYYFNHSYDNSTIQFKDLMKLVFGGIYNYTTEKKIHGAALGLFAEYLAKTYGEGVWSKIFEKYANGSDEMHAIFETTASPWELLPAFHNYLINKEEFQAFLGDFWLTEFEEEFTISNTIREKTITDSYYDLSGKWYKINLGNDLPVNKDLSIEAYSDDVAPPELSLYKFKGTTLELLGTSDSGFNIEDVKSYADEGAGFLVLVTNANAVSPYTNLSDITLSIQLPEAQFQAAIIGVDKIFGTKIDTYDDGNVITTENYISGGIGKVEGTFNGTTFSANWDDENDSQHWWGSLSITLNSGYDQIENFTIDANQTFTYGTVKSTEKISFSGSGIPRNGVFNDYWQFNVFNSEVGNYITNLNYEFRWEELDASHTFTRTINPYFFGEGSSLIIKLFQ